VDDEKMSKSLGNFFTIREVLKKYDPEVVRYFILASHYRSPLNYGDESLEQAKSALTRLYTALKELPQSHLDGLGDSTYRQRFFDAIDDDFNTPLALAVLFELARDINKLREIGSDPQNISLLGGTLVQLASVLGLLQRDPKSYLQGERPITAQAGIHFEVGATIAVEANVTNDEIDALIAARNAARKAKNFAESDRIRDELTAKGVILEDGKGGTTWRRT
jgi:cysteinyl-tRNA synthetase